MDGNFGLRAEDAAPRSFAPSDSGRPIRVRPRREVRLAGLALCPLRCNPPQRSDPSLINQTCSLRAKPACCCDFASLALRISQHRSARSKRTPVPPLHHLWCLRPARNYFPGHPHGKRTPAKRGEASWSCPLPVAQQPAAEPTQASTNRHSHASLQSTCQPRALHMTRIASRPARACLGTAQHLFFFGASDPPGLGPQGRHTGIKTE